MGLIHLAPFSLDAPVECFDQYTNYVHVLMTSALRTYTISYFKKWSFWPKITLAVESWKNSYLFYRYRFSTSTNFLATEPTISRLTRDGLAFPPHPFLVDLHGPDTSLRNDLPWQIFNGMNRAFPSPQERTT